MPFARFLVSLTACALLGACSQLSPYSDLTKLDLTLNASDQLNPDLNGRPSPLVLQLVELSHATAFEQADYFDLQQRPAAMLAPDLLIGAEYTVWRRMAPEPPAPSQASLDECFQNIETCTEFTRDPSTSLPAFQVVSAMILRTLPTSRPLAIGLLLSTVVRTATLSFRLSCHACRRSLDRRPGSALMSKL